MALGCVNIRLKLRPGTKLSSQLSDSQGRTPFPFCSSSSKCTEAQRVPAFSTPGTGYTDHVTGEIPGQKLALSTFP